MVNFITFNNIFHFQNPKISKRNLNIQIKQSDSSVLRKHPKVHLRYSSIYLNENLYVISLVQSIIMRQLYFFSSPFKNII